MKRLRIAPVGVGSFAGARSSGHLDVMAAMSDKYELCALCDMDKERLKRAGERYHVEALYTGLDEMLRQEKPDVAYRLTPTDSTTMVCIKAAEAGVHVINEIPIATTLPQADAIIDACKRNNVKLEIAENVWVWPQEQLKQKIARQGLLGKITHARLKYPCGSYHGFNAVRMILRTEPKRVMGYCGQVDVQPQKSYGGSPMSKCFFELGIFEFPDDVRLSYELPPKGRTWRHHWDIEGTHGQIYGECLMLIHVSDDITKYSTISRETEFPFRSVYEDIDGEQVLKEMRVDTDPPVVWENPYKGYRFSKADDIAKASILDSMYRAITEDIEPAYGAENGRRDLEMWIAVRESGRQGSKWIDFPITEPTETERRLTDAFRERYGCDPIEDIDKLADTPFNRLSVMWTVAGWL